MSDEEYTTAVLTGDTNAFLDNDVIAFFLCSCLVWLQCSVLRMHDRKYCC
jgi:hypothetical protein